jgi:L-ornithine N5-oxygenase
MMMAQSSPARPQPDQEVLDVVGVGFGPSNLALAIAIAEHNAGAGWSPPRR